MPITRELVTEILEANPTWSKLPIVKEQIDEEALVAWFKGEKAKTLNKIMADLAACEKAHGPEVFGDVWVHVRDAFGRESNWFAKAGMMAVWKAILRKAVARAIQKKTGVSRADQVIKELRGVFS